MENVLNDIREERARQDAKWGDQSGHSDYVWNAILGEEAGEVAKAVLEHEIAYAMLEDIRDELVLGDIRDELVQVAAVAVAWIEALDKRRK